MLVCHKGWQRRESLLCGKEQLHFPEIIGHIHETPGAQPRAVQERRRRVVRIHRAGHRAGKYCAVFLFSVRAQGAWRQCSVCLQAVLQGRLEKLPRIARACALVFRQC